jgi:hypothetical protein
MHRPTPRPTPVLLRSSLGCSPGLTHSTPYRSEVSRTGGELDRDPDRGSSKGTTLMLDASDIVVWVNGETKEIMVRTHAWGCPEDRDLGHQWGDPIGAAYSSWHELTDKQRVRLMLETAIDLAMQGYPLKDVLTAFAQVRQFRALGSQSYPMARALTSALVGRCLEPNTMSFEELLAYYTPTRIVFD